MASFAAARAGRARKNRLRQATDPSHKLLPRSHPFRKERGMDGTPAGWNSIEGEGP